MHDFHHGNTKDTETARLVEGSMPLSDASEKSRARRKVYDSPTNEFYLAGFGGGAVGLVEHPTNPISEKVIGAAIEVHRHLGPGLLESSYQACVCRELELREIRYRSQVVLPLEYKGIQIAKGYVIDLLIEDSIVVEIKSVDKLLPIHSAQLMTYMRLQKVSSGLLMNFKVEALPRGIKRILL
jgi:GxxExxY protein